MKFLKSVSAEGTMMAVSSGWNGKPSFRLIPVANDCPYVEGIFDPENKLLVLVSNIRKQSYHMLPVLDDHGDEVPAKKLRASGKKFKEERRLLDTFHEYYIMIESEVKATLNMLICNDFNYEPYFVKPEVKSEIRSEMKIVNNENSEETVSTELK